MTTTPLPPLSSSRLPLRRIVTTLHDATGRPIHRIGGGVCAGLALHLGQPVERVRVLMMLAACISGAGLLLYLALWLMIPCGNPWEEAAGHIPPARARLASPVRSVDTGGTPSTTRRLLTIGGGLILLATAIGVWRAGMFPSAHWLIPALIVVVGAAVVWSQIDAVTGPQRDRATVMRVVGGVILAMTGVILGFGADLPLRMLFTGTTTGLAIVLSVALILTPVWLRTTRAMTHARQEQARQAERADIAAHLHDSVLQTLTLIRKRADEPETVARLARSQERELRAWLYTDRPEAGASVADAVRELVADVEDRYGTPVDLVIVGDRCPDEAAEVIIAAAREALSNAVRHGAPPVSVYAEIAADSCEMFIRDRGPGFDDSAIAPDRHGVRESIIGRMQRHDGRARIRRLDNGTEVHLRLSSSASAPSPGLASAHLSASSPPETVHHPVTHSTPTP